MPTIGYKICKTFPLRLCIYVRYVCVDTANYSYRKTLCGCQIFRDRKKCCLHSNLEWLDRLYNQYEMKKKMYEVLNLILKP